MIDGKQGGIGVGFCPVDYQAIDVGGEIRETKIEVVDLDLAACCLIGAVDDSGQHVIMKATAAKQQEATCGGHNDQRCDAAEDPSDDSFTRHKKPYRPAQNAWPSVTKNCVDLSPVTGSRLCPTSNRTGPTGVL